MSFVIVFDFPKVLTSERRKLNRMLHRMGAERVQDSFWRCDDLKALFEAARFIKSCGGRVEILEEKFVF